MAIGTDFIDLQWCTAIDNVAVCGYKLYYGDGTLIEDVGLSLGYTVTGLTGNTEYCFYYTAYDCSGNESQPSNTICVTTQSDYIDMIFEFTTSAPSQNIELVSSTFDGTIDWGDGSPIETYTGTTQALSHTYSTASAHTVTITGDYSDFRFTGSTNSRLTDIIQWGSTNADTIRLDGATGLTTLTATDQPDFKPNWSATGMFSGAINFNEDIGFWDMSNVISLQNMFYGATAFNQDISSWDVSNVINMTGTFSSATTFNQPLSAWTTTSLTNMFATFEGATSFNQSLNTWDVSNVTNFWQTFKGATAFNGNITSWTLNSTPSVLFNSMFQNASSFNQDISGWDVSAGYNFEYMFCGATLFNQDISGWDMSNAGLIGHMFCDSAFNQDIGSWVITSVTDATGMFSGGSLSNSNYDALLQGWSGQSVNSSVTLDVNAEYSLAGNDGRFHLIDSHSWDINDLGCSDCPSSLDAPTLSAVSQTDTAITNQWDTISGATSYEYQYRLSGDTIWTGATDNTSPSTVTGLTENTNYEFRVRAINTALSLVSDWSTTLPTDTQSVSEVLTADLIHYYKMDETSGSTATDSVGSADGTLSLSTFVSDGKIDYGVHVWNSSGSKIDIGNTVNFDYNDPWSISTWVKREIIDDHCVIFSKADETSTSDILRVYFKSTNVIQVILQETISTSSLVVETTNVYTGTSDYHHYVITYDGSSNASGVKVYVDDVPQTLTIINDNLSGSILTTESAIIAGRSNDADPILGYIDEFGIWDGVLTPHNVGLLYNSGSGLQYPFDGVQLDTPTLSADSVTETSITNSWDTILSADSYEYQYRLSGDTTWTGATDNTSPSTVTGLTSTSTYEFRVRARALSATTSDWSTVLSATTATPQLDAPVLVNDSVTVSSVTNSWSAVTNATSYEYEYKANSGSTFSAYTDTTSPVTVTGLTESTMYNFRARALASGYTTSDWSTVLSATTSSAATSSLLTDLISYWSMEDSAGTTMTDSHGSNDGTTSNVTEGVTGKVNDAFDYNGTNAYASVADTSDLRLTGSAWTVSYWVNIDAFGSLDKAFISKETAGSSGWMHYLDVSEAKINLFNYGLTTVNAVLPTALSTDTWYHVVATYDSSDVKLYLDGASALTQSNSGTISSDTRDLWLGRYHSNNTRYTDMILDEVGIWDRALSPTEISELYNSGSGLAYPFT